MQPQYSSAAAMTKRMLAQHRGSYAAACQSMQRKQCSPFQSTRANTSTGAATFDDTVNLDTAGRKVPVRVKSKPIEEARMKRKPTVAAVSSSAMSSR